MRGVVLPLSDDLMFLGLSIVLQLRSLGVTLSVVIQYCKDLKTKLVATIEKKRNQVGQVYVYDACKLAAKEKSSWIPADQSFSKSWINVT